MENNVLCVDARGIVSPELAVSLKQLGLEQIVVENPQEAGYILRAGNIHISLLIFIAENFESFDAAEVKAFTSSDRAKELPVLWLCPVYDKKLENAIVQSGFEFPASLPFDEREFQKRVCRLLGMELRGYIPGLENDLAVFDFDDMLNRELKSAARGHYDLALLMLAITSVSGKDSLHSGSGGNMMESWSEKGAGNKGEGHDGTENLSADRTMYDDGNELAAGHEPAVLLKSILKLYIRATDTVFLAGSNGIAVILPFADKDGARSVAEKAEELLRNHSELSKLSKGYTVKSCIVLYPDDAKTKVRLLEPLRSFSSQYLRKPLSNKMSF